MNNRKIVSKINPSSDVFKENRMENLKLIDELNKYQNESLFQGKEKHTERAIKQGKLLARDRIELLLDQDSPFLELLPLIGLGGDGLGAGGTMVCGLGFVNSKICMIMANVGTRKGGSIDYFTYLRSKRVNEIISTLDIPAINLVESGGVFLPHQAKVFNLGGAMFKELTKKSRAGNTSVSVVFGTSTAGGAYIPGMSDYIIMVKEQAKMFLAGPPLVKMATNEVTDEESLGGAEMHSTVSGVSDYLAENENEGIGIARDIISTLPKDEVKVERDDVVEPFYDKEEILGIIPSSIRVRYDAQELIARIVDGSTFMPFKPEFGDTLVTGWAKIHGYKVAIIANNGVLNSDSANKGAHFIQLCNKKNTPIIFLQNITGFIVGTEYEQNGIIKNGAKMINAVSNCDVPKITINVGSSYGAGNYAMNGRAYDPAFMFSYPNAKLAVMGSEQLAGVMEIIQNQAAKKQGIEVDKEQQKVIREAMIAEQEKVATSWHCSGQGWDDGVIDPRETRNYLALCLYSLSLKEIKGSDSFGVFRM